MIPSSSIFSLKPDGDFEKIALEVFRFQSQHVRVYHDYIQQLGVNPDAVASTDEIPFLPIQLFKTQDVIAEACQPEATFTSSGTTGNEVSRHRVADLSLYRESFTRTFSIFYGSPSDYCILALLPSYLERSGSSLVFMVDELIRQTGNPDSGFYLNQLYALTEKLSALDRSGQKTILIGVSFALLDLAERFTFNLQNTIIMETGGMKGRRKEVVREELHSTLCSAFGVNVIHSEYGMTELLSQAYSAGKGMFRCPPWMRVMIGSTDDPFCLVGDGRTGIIKIIDLANLYSCSFIQTQDMGKLHSDGCFEVLGRMDDAPIRGCNLLVYD